MFFLTCKTELNVVTLLSSNDCTALFSFLATRMGKKWSRTKCCTFYVELISFQTIREDSTQMAELRDKYEIIGDVRGKGLQIGVEMVKDKVVRSKQVTHISYTIRSSSSCHLRLNMWAEQIQFVFKNTTVDQQQLLAEKISQTIPSQNPHWIKISLTLQFTYLVMSKGWFNISVMLPISKNSKVQKRWDTV